MALEITPALSLLDEHHLLKEVVNEQKLTFENVTYDSRKVSDNTLFFCKGNFKPSYLTSALEKVQQPMFLNKSMLKEWMRQVLL